MLIRPWAWLGSIRAVNVTGGGRSNRRMSLPTARGGGAVVTRDGRPCTGRTGTVRWGDRSDTLPADADTRWHLVSRCRPSIALPTTRASWSATSAAVAHGVTVTV